MRVTIILDDFNLSSFYPSTSTKKSAEKILKLRVSRHLQVYLIAILLAIGCLVFQMPIAAVVILGFSTICLVIYRYLKSGFDVDIQFSKADALDEAIKENLFD